MGVGNSVVRLPKCEPKLTPKSVPSSSLSDQTLKLVGDLQSGGTMTNGTLTQPQYTEVFPSAATSTLPIGNSGFVEYNTAHSSNWQSMEATGAHVSQRQSRSRHRHLIDSRHNNSFADAAAVVTAADACISDIRRVEENLRMESRMLSENNNIPMARCSTPSPAYCFHCDHAHRERCCLYIGDKPEDGPLYSRWKRDLENPSVRPQYIPKIPEAVSGNSTPFWFPAYTYTKPEVIKQKMMEKNPPPPAVWMRQFYYPIVGYGHEHQLMNQVTVEPPTPYQQYLQQHQQELYRMYQQQQQQQQPLVQQPACRHGRKCDVATPATPQYIAQPAQFHPQQNLQNTPQVAGEYMHPVQVHPPSAYYYHHQTNVYNATHHQHHHPQQHYPPPVSYTSVPIYHDAYLHPPSHYPVHSYPPPPREPTPPAPTTSTPLWLLFCQKLSRKFPDRSKKSSPTKGVRSPSKNFPHHHNLRHNPVTTTTTVGPDYLPPKYASIDPQMQYQTIPGQAYNLPLGTTYYNHLPPPPPQSAAVASMNDIGMYYVTPATVNI